MSVEVYLRKHPGGSLVPDDAKSRERLGKFKVGTVLKTELTKPRNYQFHKKFFAMLTVGYENQELYTDFEEFRDAVTVEAGFYVEQRQLDGTVIRVAKSISFGSMEDLEFNDVYAQVFGVLLHKVLRATEAEGAAFQSAIDDLCEFARGMP